MQNEYPGNHTERGGVLIVLMTLVQIAPLKINPWSAIGRAIGKVLNKDVLNKLDKMEETQTQTIHRLDKHIRIDDERNADWHRARILQFNTELLRKLPHTDEDFHEMLYNIDSYERYCTEHPEYPNSRAIHAIKHIESVYDERLAGIDEE